MIAPICRKLYLYDCVLTRAPPGDTILAMMTLATFLEHIDRASGKRSDNEISRAAGLAGNALARIREDKVPSLERAARLADAVGLELCLRRKGEALDLLALRYGILKLLLSNPGSGGPAEAEKAVSIIEPAYTSATEIFALAPDEKRASLYVVLEDALLDLTSRLIVGGIAEDAERAAETGEWPADRASAAQDPDEDDSAS